MSRIVQRILLFYISGFKYICLEMSFGLKQTFHELMFLKQYDFSKPQLTVAVVS